MVDFSFNGLFKTTNMGIPLNPLPSGTTLSKSYYGYSVAIQSIILLYFVAYFIISIIRVIKKIKNPKFKDIQEDLMDQQQRHHRENMMSQQKTVKHRDAQTPNENEKVPNIIPYRFDGEEQQQNKRKEKQRQNEEKQKNAYFNEQNVKEDGGNQDFNDYHDQKEQYYLQLDNKMMFLQPFLISFIICNNMFAADIISVIAIILMFISYYLFNVREWMSRFKFTPLLFMLFSILGYLSFFINDHDLTT